VSSTYKGWIPTASGKLSYSIIGSSKYPTPAKTANIADLDFRHIVSFQKRPLNDSAFPVLKRLLVNALFNQNGTFWFAFIAQGLNSPINESNEIRGTIFIFSDKDQWKELVPKIKKFQGYLKKFPHLDNDTSLEDYFKDKQSNLLQGLEPNCMATIEVKLERNGVATLEYVKSKISNPSPMRVDIDSSISLQELVCQQAFFYLKDITHEHQHHSQKTDTMVGLHLIKDDESEAIWYSRTLKRLYKKVLEFKRSKDQNIYASTLGLLAYVDSFCSIAKEKLDTEEYLKIPIKNHETLKSSIKASEDQGSQKYTDRKRVVDTVRTTIFSLIGVFLSLAGFANFLEIDSKKSTVLRENISDIITFCESNFSLIFLLMTAFMICILFYEGLITWKKWAVFHDIIRIIQPFHKKTSSLIVFMIGLLIADLFYILYHSIPIIFRP
jgi:hypothetical protein